MWGWAVQLLLSAVVGLVVSAIFTPPPEHQPPPELSSFKVTTASQDRSIPVIWGKPINRGTNLVWYGGIRTTRITKRIDGGLFGKDKDQTVGWNYFLSLHLALSVADSSARLLKMWYGGEVCYNNEAGLSGKGYANNFKKPNDETPGTGIQGGFTFYPGGKGTPVDSHLKHYQGAKTPAYRHVSHIVFEGVLIGETRTPENIFVQVQRLPQALRSGSHNIDGHANGAEIIYECLTNDNWGLGFPASAIDRNSFLEVAQILSDERFGLSMIWEAGTSMEDMINHVLKHIDGLLYADATTGLFVLRLMRKSEETDLAHLNQSNIIVLENCSRPSRDETANEVKVIYPDYDSVEDNRVMQVQDVGGYVSMGGQIISTQIQYPGIGSDEIAARVATRDLRNASYPLLKVSLKCMRLAHTLNPGDKFLFSWEPDGIHNVPMIVLDIDYGTLDAGEIALDALEDIFTLGDAYYEPPSTPGLTPEDLSPKPITSYKLMETPYLLLTRRTDNVRLIGEPLIMAEKPTPASMSYNLSWMSSTSTWVDAPDASDFTAKGTLIRDYGITHPVDTSGELHILIDPGNFPTTLTPSSDSDIRDQFKGLVVIGDELAVLKDFSLKGDVLTVQTCWRGLVDTVMTTHPAGTDVWFISEGYGELGVTYPHNELVPGAEQHLTKTYTIKARTNAIDGSLADDQQPTFQLKMRKRVVKPYPVANLKINGQYGTEITGTHEDITFTYNWRGRIQQAALIPQTDPSHDRGENTSLTIEIYDGSGNLKKRISGITDNSYILKREDEGEGLFGDYEVRLTTYLDGEPSFQTEVRKFKRVVSRQA